MVSLSSCSCITPSGLRHTRRNAGMAVYQGEGFPRFSNAVLASRERKRPEGSSGRLRSRLARMAKAIDLEREPERC